MKKIITLALILLLMFTLMLTGCGGGSEEPVVEEPAVEDTASVTKEDLMAQYNVFATLFNELDTPFAESGIYDTNVELKANMDHAYELLGVYEVLVQSDEVTDDERVELFNEIQLNIDSLNRAKEANL